MGAGQAVFIEGNIGERRSLASLVYYIGNDFSSLIRVCAKKKNNKIKKMKHTSPPSSPSPALPPSSPSNLSLWLW